MNSLLLTLLLSLPTQEPASPTGMHKGLQTIKLSAASERVLTCAGLSPEERAIANEMKNKIEELRSLREQIVAERLALNSAIDELTLLSDSLSARASKQEQEQIAKTASAVSASVQHQIQNPQNKSSVKNPSSKAEGKGTGQDRQKQTAIQDMDPAALVTVIERMKAPKAAAVLAKMRPDLAKDIVRRMKPGKAAKLLSAVDDKQAAIYASALVKKVEAKDEAGEQP